MFGRLVQKELLHHLLDLRFIAVFALCALLSTLSVYVGVQDYVRRLQEYNRISDSHRRSFQENSLNKGMLRDLVWGDYRWSRRPEVLSVVGYGLSGTLGQEVLIRYMEPPTFEASVFESDPIHALFDVLDLAFIVKIVLSLCVLLFTYDAVCGEKEGGTLRLYASFPVRRSTLALAKLVGSTLAVLVPFLFSCLLVSGVLAFSPGMGLQGKDWGRIATLMGIFTLYVIVFAAFGVFVSALTHRRMTAFLGLLGLWTLWVFVIPNLAVDIARRIVPGESIYDLRKQALQWRWETRTRALAEVEDYQRSHPVKDWNALSRAQQEEIRDAPYKIQTKWDAEYDTHLKALQTRRRNHTHQQQGLSMALSALSPLGVVNFLSMDLTRTGPVQQERIEDALNQYLLYLCQYIQTKQRSSGIWGIVNLSDFSWFTYQDTERVGECLSRNLFPILNLALLAVFGFAGAYVAILRYDVR